MNALCVLIRFDSPKAAVRVVERFREHNSLEVRRCAYNTNTWPSKDSVCWQWQAGTEWKSYPKYMSDQIEKLPPYHTKGIIHSQDGKKYEVIRYDDSQGKQISARTGNQRCIRRLKIGDSLFHFFSLFFFAVL